MSDHETVRQLLALGAAGLLDAGEERLLREHTRECAACAAELGEFAALSAGLRALPAPEPPADLVARTAVLVAAEADRRQGAILAGGAAIFALAFVLLMGQTLRIVAGDTTALVWLVWASISSVLGAVSALVLAPRRRLERRIV
jgi:predicted anti-sigma-YlaC factor YlaD